MATKAQLVSYALNACFQNQIDDGWKRNEGLRGLKVGDAASCNEEEEMFGVSIPNGTFTVERRKKTYIVAVTHPFNEHVRLDITRVS
jgi:hypothetical protein